MYVYNIVINCNKKKKKKVYNRNHTPSFEIEIWLIHYFKNGNYENGNFLESYFKIGILIRA